MQAVITIESKDNKFILNGKDVNTGEEFTGEYNSRNEAVSNSMLFIRERGYRLSQVSVINKF
jgi:hypothetical protein